MFGSISDERKNELLAFISSDQKQRNFNGLTYVTIEHENKRYSLNTSGRNRDQWQVE